jgi:cell division septation protein DedD
MILRYLVAAALVFGASTQVCAQSVNAGVDAWQKADYSRAVAIWRPLAENGNADAQFNLGQAYRLGRGVPTNLATAKSWLEKAANQRHVDAETTLGLLLFQNGDHVPALKWLKMAADQGEPRAMLIYGTALVNGDSVTQNPIVGYAYVSRANAQGLPAAREIVTQLDKMMSVADRKKALAIAGAQAKAAGQSMFNARKAVSVAKPAKPAKQAVVAAAKPMPAKAATATPAPASGAWRIQLGAFSQRGAAEALYAKLSGKAALAGRRPFYIPVGAVTRLQVGPFESKAAAAAACGAVGVACFPAPAK